MERSAVTVHEFNLLPALWQARITLQEVLRFICCIGGAFVISWLILSQSGDKHRCFSSFVSFLPQTWGLDSGAFVEGQVHT